MRSLLLVCVFAAVHLPPHVLGRSNIDTKAGFSHRKHRFQRSTPSKSLCGSIVGDGVGIGCHFSNVCVDFGEHITLTLPRQTALKARIPKRVLINTRPQNSTDRRHVYLRARVAVSENTVEHGETLFHPGHHVLVHSICWNYGHWLYDTAIPLHQLTKSSYTDTVTVVDLNSQECGSYHNSTFGLPFHFANGTLLESKNATLCFSSLVAGFSPDWGLEAQYNPALYSGPSLDQYQSFRDALYTDSSPTSTKRILISKRTGPRRIINIDTVAVELANRVGSQWSVELVDFANMTIDDQIKTIRSASAIIGLGGSNVLNAVFARDGFRVFEVLPVRMHDFHTNTFKRMPYICHVVHKATDNETVFLDENVAWIDKSDFAKQYYAPEDWKDSQSSRLWHSSASIMLDVDRFWQAVHATLTAPCESTTYSMFFETQKV